MVCYKQVTRDDFYFPSDMLRPVDSSSGTVNGKSSRIEHTVSSRYPTQVNYSVRYGSDSSEHFDFSVTSAKRGTPLTSAHDSVSLRRGQMQV